MATVQHWTARELLPLIMTAAVTNTPLTYGKAAEMLGRPKNNARMVAQTCDLLDAAAAYAGIPLLALVTVREKGMGINRKAWADRGPELRRKIINTSLARKFDRDDFQAISTALEELSGKSNREAWKFILDTLTKEELFRRIAGDDTTKDQKNEDAINDIGSDIPERFSSLTISYNRDPRIRAAVIRRASGKCEFCGVAGFKRLDGSPYLECHHIIALSNDGADRMTNVIALCANDHREAHFGKRRDDLEREMMRRLKTV
jgi:hypothetical protein